MGESKDKKKDLAIDKYKYLAVAEKLKQEYSVADMSQHRELYIGSRKDYLKAIIALSDAVEVLPDESPVMVDGIMFELITVAYSVQRYLTILAAQAPLDSNEQFNPFINTGKQLTNGMTVWKDDMNVNLESALMSFQLPEDKAINMGLKLMVSSMINASEPDSIISTFLVLIYYLERFNLTTVTDINSGILRHK